MFERLQQVFRKESGFRAFLLSILVMGIGYGLYKGLIDNYLAEIVTMNELDRGVAEFFRELPGLLLVFILAAFYTLSAERIFRMGSLIMLGGMAMLPVLPADKALVTLAVCVYSLGDHIQMGMKNTLSMEYAHSGQEGKALGHQSAVYQVGTLAGYLVIIAAFFFFTKDKPYRPFFVAAAVLTGLGALITFRVKGSSKPEKNVNRFYFRKKFFKYYMLEVFYGARKQVFLTFGPYVLVRFYHADAGVISLLFAVSAVACYFLAPVAGSIIDRVGYRIVMISDTLILVIVCFFYGFAHHLFLMPVAFVVCCVNYVLDSVISLASMASNVYVKDISDSPEETRATISTGISVNHLITILIALFGGMIWRNLGIETLFILSAVLGLLNSAYAATIRTGRRPAKAFR